MKLPRSGVEFKVLPENFPKNSQHLRQKECFSRLTDRTQQNKGKKTWLLEFFRFRERRDSWTWWYLGLVRLCPHPVGVHQADMLTRVVEAWGLVGLHQLTPAEHVAQVELPGASFLAPPPFHDHFLNKLTNGR